MLPKTLVVAGLMAPAVSAMTVDLSRPTCLTNEPTEEDIENTERLIDIEDRARLSGNSSLFRQPVTVPTYFHIIAADETASGGWITDEQVSEQLDVINQDFAPHDFSFDLLDVTRTVNPTWANNQQQSQFKSELREGDYDTLNLYIVQNMGGGALGVCTFPSSSAPPGGSTFINDGCTVIADSVPGGAAEGFNLGKTATHEIGHWLYLYHTFQGSGCSEPGDYVDDTPTQQSASSGCPVGRNSCPDLPGEDPITNYMDYSSDSCFEEFTDGQTVRMHNAWEEFRA